MMFLEVEAGGEPECLQVVRIDLQRMVDGLGRLARQAATIGGRQRVRVVRPRIGIASSSFSAAS